MFICVHADRAMCVYASMCVFLSADASGGPTECEMGHGGSVFSHDTCAHCTFSVHICCSLTHSKSSSFYFLCVHLPPPHYHHFQSLQLPLYLSVATLFRIFISVDKALPAMEFVFLPALPLSSIWLLCMCSHMRETEKET